ncbi:glycogen phosphorylase [Desulfocucumis palustris]|uniref:glycogen phosphorylase n=1 Tax=Desulfocucumis palustris TaxID=1898651 RepID=A0A2L2XEM4_9FIRM|nr:alpha-glucan family phosphorylase [Desulfocucumis palustris]GBF34610.1 glycogen phosphorylase [Desulfocucumis palustris]
MYSFCTLSVIPRLPDNISRLNEIAYNFWFSWDRPARELFFRINRQLWEDVYHNPVKFLLRVKQDQLQAAAGDPEYISLYRQVMERFDRYMTEEKWYQSRYPGQAGQGIAYFSAEFGLHESHPIYSGGLGLLAGDHLKSASDLGVPLVGIGLLYKHGYFTQRINSEGRQEVEYPYLSFHEMPMSPVTGEDGKEVLVRVALPGRKVYVRVWEVKVGRVKLYLLDTDMGRNCREDRDITAQLYGGNKDVRMAQEIVLGIGGVRALRELKINPHMWHINEGHAAFLCLERLREKVQNGISPQVAAEAVQANTLFTTHTPVPAGHDTYSAEMMDHYFGHYYSELGMSRDEFICLGWDHDRAVFNMTFLAMNFADFVNGVSELHGHVSRCMFSKFFGSIPPEEVPIFHITNGVHSQTMMAGDMKELFSRYLAPDWYDKISQADMWERVENIPDDTLWAVHMSLKRKTIDFIRHRLKMQRIRNYEPTHRVEEVDKFLDPEILTIGFARRFATYKRATLIFRDYERLVKLVNSSGRPLQIIFSGKAHPADHPGQELIKRINDITREEPFKGKIIFLENYDINVARHLVQGVDVWLNNPRRPQEASGTSGMKAALNGGLNFSVLDGWWPEAYNGRNGFAIGEGKDCCNEEIQDLEDSLSLYSMLEEKIIPLYYQREAGIPVQWVKYMKNSIKTIVPYFSTHRMVREYAERYYIPGIARGVHFRRENFTVAARLEAFKEFLKNNWHQVSVTSVETGNYSGLSAGDSLEVHARVYLGSIWHKDVVVEIAYGEALNNSITGIKTVPMEMEKQLEEGTYLFAGKLLLPPGSLGYTVRVRPSSPDFTHKFEMPLVTWAHGLD